MEFSTLKNYFLEFTQSRRMTRHFYKIRESHSKKIPIYDDVSKKFVKSMMQASAENEGQLLTSLGTSRYGLTDTEAARIRKVVGSNEIHREESLPLLLHLWHCYKNPFNILLTALSLFSYFSKDIGPAIFIFLMILLSTLLRLIQEVKANKAADALKSLVKTVACTLRKKAEARREADTTACPPESVGHDLLPIEHLVPGDILLLSAGDMVPADCRILTSKDFFINQSAFTGESMPVEKFPFNNEKASSDLFCLDNVIFMGTHVVSGSAMAVVLKTGGKTYLGMFAHRVSDSTRNETFLQKGVNEISWLLIRFMYVMTPFVFLLNVFTKENWNEALFFSFSVAVGLTPEMLPMIVTSTLAKGAISLSKKKIIVKQLDAIQNFGAMDILCSDKTGTITQDKVFLAKHIDAWGTESDEVLKMAYLNSYYQTGLRNILDIAVLEHAHIAPGSNISSEFRKIDEIPFDFVRRRMSVVVSTHNKKHILICKGAVDEILSVCNSVRLGKTEKVLDSEQRKKLKKFTDTLNQDGMRVVAVALKDSIPVRECYGPTDEKELTLIGYMTFLDPPKESAAPAIKALSEQGVSIKILTGDNLLVTEKVCREVGLKITGLLSGFLIERMQDSELSIAVEEVTIFAQLTPIQKERVVRLLRANGHVVGFLGDGINDAAALRAADIGISLDTAADIAKEAADIILLEKNLVILHEGVAEGRRTFVNIIKYIKMTASSNFGNVISVSIASIFLPFLPMLPVQILLQNFLYDISQTAIPFDAVDKDQIEKPLNWNTREISRFMLFFGPISSIFDLITFAIMWFAFHADSIVRQSIFQSGWFVMGLLTQTLIVHTIRTQKVPFLQSRAAPQVITMTVIISLVGALLPLSPFAPYAKLHPLPLNFYLCVPFIIFGYVWLTQEMKIVYAKSYL